MFNSPFTNPLFIKSGLAEDVRSLTLSASANAPVFEYVSGFIEGLLQHN